MQHDRKHSDWKKDMSELQLDTIEAIRDKAATGYLHQYDVGRRDTREERISIDINLHDVDQHDKHKEKIDVDITVKIFKQFYFSNLFVKFYVL